jgi:hypothetical protein
MMATGNQGCILKPIDHSFPPRSREVFMNGWRRADSASREDDFRKDPLSSSGRGMS